MAKQRSSLTALLVLGLLLFVLFLLWRSQPSGPDRSNRRRPEAGHSRAPYRERGREEQRRPRENREPEAACETLGLRCESRYFAAWHEPEISGCRTAVSHGYPVPDPRCTPGGVNPSVTEEVLRNPAWRTRCLRNCESSEAGKHVAYGWYSIRKPKVNSGEQQVCELDHLVPLELGGADGLGNIWPECGPDGVALNSRDFKRKDRVESYLAEQVRAGRMPLATAQRGIAEDWTQFLPAADRFCTGEGHC